MAIRYFSGTSIVTTDNTSAIVAATNDQIIVGAGAVRGATGNGTSHGITTNAGATQVDVLLQGMTFGVNGVDFSNATGTNSIIVAAGGYVTASQAALYLAGSEISVRNSGVIEGLDSAGGGVGYVVVYSTADETRIFNDGRITSRNFADAIRTESSIGTTIVNSGIIEAFEHVTDLGSAVSLSGAGSDWVWNSGTILGGVNFASGNDLFQGGGRVVGAVNGGAGNDTLVGGSFGDTFVDISGSNWIVGGGGDDEITIGNSGATVGSTTAWGGDANFSSDNSLNDTLIVSGFAANIFLGGRVSDVASGAIAAWIWGFENATGTTLNDSIIGTAGNNIIKGNGGADWLVGNGGFDQFVFDSTASNNSTISGFSADLIDLHNIDANSTLTDDQAFVFRTVHTSNAAAEMVFTNFGAGGQIQLYTNADNVVDATIFISYAAGSAAPVASDFWL